MGLDAADIPFLRAEAERLSFSGTALVVGGEAADVSRFGFAHVEALANLSAADGAALSPFDAVFDLGASMRAFSLARFFAALGRQVAVGGRAIHAVPSANHIDQSFYMASPRLFHDYYRANSWRLDTLMLLRRARGADAVEGISYTPGSLAGVAHGGLDDGAYRVFCVATRLPESTVGRIPQHGQYVQAWTLDAPPRGGDATPVNPLVAWLRRTRWAYRIANACIAPRKKARIRAACLKPAVRYAIPDFRR